MEEQAIDEQLVRRYLLGEIAEEEREVLEKRLLTDDDFYETFTALEDHVEDELIDQYVDGELTGPARDNFTQLLLNTPERAEKLRLVTDLKARAMQKTVSEPVVHHVPTEDPPKPALWQRHAPFRLFQNPWVGLSCAVAAALLILCIVWLAVKSSRLESQLRQLQAREHHTPTQDTAVREQLEQLRARNEELVAALTRAEEERNGMKEELAYLKTREGVSPEQPGQTKPRAPRPVIFSLFLPATRRGVSDGEQERVLTLPSAASQTSVQARLVVGVENIAPNTYRSFRAVVSERGGREVWRSDAVRVTIKGNQGRAVLLVPAERLTEGGYVVDLSGLTADGQTEPLSYVSFRIGRK